MKDSGRSNASVGGKAKRGRKRKRVIGKKEGSDDGSVNSDQIEDLGNSCSDIEVKEIASESENGGNADSVKPKGKRGRKRKNVEVSGEKKPETVALDGVTQVNGRVLRSRTMASEESSGIDLNKANVESDDEDEDEEMVQPIVKVTRKKKKGRGRPRKVPEAGASDMVVDRKDQAEKSTQKGVKRAVLKTNKSLTGLREEKQVVREQILAMILKSGWKIDYRPRNGSREYNDAVYVDPIGRTHWSITKAYKKLKEKIDNGTADSQEIAGFEAIPDERLSKLCKVMEKKRNDFGKKKGKGVTLKKPFKTKKNLVQKPKIRKKPGRKPRNAPEGTKKKKRYALLARGSETGSNRVDDGYVLYPGKRTLFSWLIETGIITDHQKVHYMHPKQKRALREGLITGDGIVCVCCDELHTTLSFESHAGSDLGEPLKYISLRGGSSILNCIVDSWFKHESVSKIGFCNVDVSGKDTNDDTCNICGDGGALICCDGCPSTFHQSCLDIEEFPSGDWHCLYCSCKFCGSIGGENSEDEESSDELSICQLCEEKFHVSCIEDHSKSPAFCGEECRKIFKRIKKLLGATHDIQDGFSWVILKRRKVEYKSSLNDRDLLKVACNSLLAVAFSVMDESFLPIVDERSKSNMIHNVVYNCGSNIKRLDYSSFYTIILKREDEVVAAASVRIHGRKLAEMPFIATRYRYRRQGMCRRLLNAVEAALSFVKVKKLVIPAISELNETWTNVFGFKPLEESERQEMKSMSLIVFPGTSMLQKPLQKPADMEEAETSQSDSESSEEDEDEDEAEDNKAVDELSDEYPIDSPSGSDSNDKADVKMEQNGETKGAEGSASDITKEASKEKNNEWLDLNEPADEKDVDVPELSGIDGPPGSANK